MDPEVVMIGWHGTTGDFDGFDEAWFGSCPDRSPNGRLGVWVYLREGLAENAGHRVLEVEADVPNERIARLSSRRMLQDHLAAGLSGDPHGYFVTLRDKLRAEGYQAIVVEEMDGAEMMGVILDLAVVSNVRDLTAPGRRP